MSKYATEQKFGGQRASVGRIVLLAAPKHDDPTKVCLRAGIIVAISGSKDLPYIALVGCSTYDTDWKFFNVSGSKASDEETLAQMPLGSWTWPPRV